VYAFAKMLSVQTDGEEPSDGTQEDEESQHPAFRSSAEADSGSRSRSPTPHAHARSSEPPELSAPLQKRRRVLRACDRYQTILTCPFYNTLFSHLGVAVVFCLFISVLTYVRSGVDSCRHRKIKCDGKEVIEEFQTTVQRLMGDQASNHVHIARSTVTVRGERRSLWQDGSIVDAYHIIGCTYDKPSNRRRNLGPAYIEGLENRLHKAESILRTVMPGVNLDDPRFDGHNVDQILEPSHPDTLGAQLSEREKTTSKTETSQNSGQDDDAQLQTMVQGCGSLDLDDQGHWDYHGNSSGLTFIQNLRTQFGDLFVPYPRTKHRAVSHLVESPKSSSSSAYESHHHSSTDLPDKDTAMRLCRNSLEIACALMRFVHKPNFYRKVTQLYDTDPDHYTNSETQFLPLLYVVMAVGCLFDQTADDCIDTHGFESTIEKGLETPLPRACAKSAK
jgi:hypothetical protein